MARFEEYSNSGRKALCRVALVLAAVSTAGGCTPARWVHPEYGTARLTEDEHACTTIAREEAWRADTSGGTVLRSRREFPNSALDDYDLLGTEPPLDLPLRLRDTCMRAKGYQLTQ